MRKRIMVTAVVVLTLFMGFTLAMAAETMEKKPVVSGKPDMPEKKDVAPAKQDPGRTKILNLLKSKSDDATINQAKAYLTNNPEDADVLILLAEAYLNRENFAAAEASAKQAAVFQPNNPSLKKIYSKINMLKAYKEGNFDAALQQVNKELAANPKDPGLLNEKMKIYMAQVKTYMSVNERAKANEALDAAIAISDAKQKSELLAMKEMVNKPAAPQPKPKE